jgi:hypothetical protein
VSLRDEGLKDENCEDITPEECKGPGYNGSYQTGFTDKHRRVSGRVFSGNWGRIFSRREFGRKPK